MKPFFSSIVIIAIIAFGSSLVLENQKMSAKDVFKSQTGNVRLDDVRMDSGTK